MKRSKHLQGKLKGRQEGRTIEKAVEDQFHSGRVLACISSRPGQSGRVDGYVLEGKELEFYQKKLEKKKK
jgi:small subunit ribosomal protein S8e